MDKKTRRIITCTDSHGKSVIQKDENLTPSFTSAEFPGLEITEIYRTTTMPVDLYETYQSLSTFARDLPPGHTRFGILRMPPLKELLAQQKFLGQPVDDIKKFRLHKTNTIDYVTILSGQITLVLDSKEEATLSTGNLLIQRGTMHTWHNHSNTACFMSIVQIGAKNQR